MHILIFGCETPDIRVIMLSGILTKKCIPTWHRPLTRNIFFLGHSRRLLSKMQTGYGGEEWEEGGALCASQHLNMGPTWFYYMGTKLV